MWNHGNTVEESLGSPLLVYQVSWPLDKYDIKNSTMKFGVYKKHVAICDIVWVWNDTKNNLPDVETEIFLLNLDK